MSHLGPCRNCEEGGDPSWCGANEVGGGGGDRRRFIAGIHVYAQQHEHDEALIAGTPGELAELGRKLISAVQTNTPVRLANVGHADGEYYDIHVIPVETLEGLSDVYAMDRDDRGVQPHELVRDTL